MDLDHKVSEDLVRTAVWAEDSLRYAREHDQPELAWLLGAVKADVELEGALFAVPSGERPARVRCSAGPEEAARHYVRSAADTADDLRRREREQEKGRARVAAFHDEGMESFIASPKAKRRVLPPAIRRKIVDLKAEHPPLNLGEIANVCGRLFGRRPDGHTVKAVLEESAIPRKLVRRFPPYHEAGDVAESRKAVVTSIGRGGRTRASRAT